MRAASGSVVVGIVAAGHVDFDVAEAVLGEMRFQRGERFLRGHVGDQAHVDFREGFAGQNGFAAWAGVTADEAFDVDRRFDINISIDSSQSDIVDPVLDALHFLGVVFVRRFAATWIIFLSASDSG